MLFNKNTYYDFKKQISFWDKSKQCPVFNILREGTVLETSTVENSDPDEFSSLGFDSRLTESTENSDVDGFTLDFSGTKETRSIEDSDIDSIIAITSTITKSIEDSYADGYINPPTTQTTFTVKNSDVDEFAMI